MLSNFLNPKTIKAAAVVCGILFLVSFVAVIVSAFGSIPPAISTPTALITPTDPIASFQSVFRFFMGAAMIVVLYWIIFSGTGAMADYQSAQQALWGNNWELVFIVRFSIVLLVITTCLIIYYFILKAVEYFSKR